MSAKTPKINVTKNYRMFARVQENRPLNPGKHRKLRESMVEHGFMPHEPIRCYRDDSNALVVWDGQHRLHFAEELELSVYWMECEPAADVADLNETMVKWVPADYAHRFSAMGKAAYTEAIQFHEDHGIAIGLTFAILGGYTNFTQVADDFYAGTFEVRDRKWAAAVASVYSELRKLEPKMKGKPFLLACMAACRAVGFAPKRLLKNAERARGKLAAYSNRDDYLSMLEEVYNHAQQSLYPLRIEAQKAMRDRNPAVKDDDAA